ncbi:MAG TPA: hypothetical protein VNA69_07625 [Thermoanaerobaculia bacterium]|nr:hypothetical protein [Thermoanaerobaculia bacterium]
MRRFLLFALLLAPSLAFAQWVEVPDKGCVGGSGCADRRLRVALEDRPIIGVRFNAHDSVGSKAEGVLRVKIDGTTVRGYIDIPRAGETFSLDVDELRGRYLVFEPVTNDEVVISDIAVLYGAAPRNKIRTLPAPIDRTGGWRSYPDASVCIGGDQCRKNGKRVTIALEDRPVIGIRFHAHDSIGQRADGRLSVRIDDTSISSRIDVQRAGRLHDFEVDNVRGTRLVIETTTDDEVELKDVAVLYGRLRRADRREDRQRETRHEGGCIGGDECGGSRARIRIPLYGRTVKSVRFYARDDIGTRAGGELRIRIDDEILRNYLDIPREGRTFTIDGRGVAGDYLVIETTEHDEVELKDIRIAFGEDEIED